MYGPNQWRKSTKSTARGPNDPKPSVPNEEAYRSEDSEYNNVPHEGYAARQSREVPQERAAESRREEDHMMFCYSFRQECQCYMDTEFVKLLIEKGIHSIKGPLDMSPFCKRQMAMDAVS